MQKSCLSQLHHSCVLMRVAATRAHTIIATTARRYNSYSGAAIGGTLLMLIPVAYYDGLLFEFAKSFAISALLGGGLGAYLSLRKDGVGEKAGEFGSAVVNKVKEI